MVNTYSISHLVVHYLPASIVLINILLQNRYFYCLGMQFLELLALVAFCYQLYANGVAIIFM